MNIYVPPPNDGDLTSLAEAAVAATASSPSKSSAHRAAFGAETPETAATSKISTLSSPAYSAGSKRTVEDPSDLMSLKRATLAGARSGLPETQCNLGDYLTSESEGDVDSDADDDAPPAIKDIRWEDPEQQRALYMHLYNCEGDATPVDLGELVAKNIKKLTKDELTVAMHCFKDSAERPNNAPAMRSKLTTMVLKALKKMQASEKPNATVVELEEMTQPANPHIPKVALKKPATDKDYTKSSGMNIIMSLFAEHKIDTVSVRRKDSDEDEVFDLHKGHELVALTQVIGGTTDHLVGWKLIQRHKEDRDMAKAMEVESTVNRTNPSTPLKGAFAEGFTPPSTTTPAKASAAEQQGETTKIKGENIFNMDNDDEDVAAVWTPKAKALQSKVKQQGTGSKSGNIYFVSPPFPHTNEAKISHVIVWDPAREAWFLHAGHPSVMFELMAKDLKYQLPEWQASFTEVPIRKVSYGDNEYKRRNSGKGNSVGRTINKIMFVFTYKVSEEPMFQQMLLSAFKKIERLYHPAAQPGSTCLTYMKENSPGIVDYFHKQYPEDDKLEAYLHQTLVDVFARKRSVVLDCHLDRFLMDNQIKEFLQGIGVNGWDEVNLDRVFKNWPKPIMQWADIEHKPYDE